MPGWVREKYNADYFLCTGEPGVGALGIENYNAGEPHPRIVELLKQVVIPGRSVLDIGCGRGEALKYCLERGARFVAGLDFSDAAISIASKYLEQWRGSCEAVMIHSDLLTYAEKVLSALRAPHYDIVLMFDVIEHIPRRELAVAMPLLRRSMRPGSLLIATVPFYPLDNDVVEDGVRPGAWDSSDKYPETQGMHCNRYTKDSFRDAMVSFGFASVKDLTIWKPDEYDS